MCKYVKIHGMSNIAVALDNLIRQSKPRITGADLARTTGIDLSQLSRIRNGHQSWVNPKYLHSIAQAFCSNVDSKKFAQIHAQLLFARLKDDCAGPGSNLIVIDLLSDSPMELKDKPAKPVLAPSLQQNLDIIAEHIEADTNIRDLVATAAKLCRRKSISQPS